jgi:sterol desaturase/sphingolipid hydroxylase (fatty acid hydroxylase superfamily)
LVSSLEPHDQLAANEMTLPAAVRLGWTGTISGGWLVFMPLILLGFPPLMVGGLLAANLLYQYSLHTEAVGRLWAPIEYIFNTPSHHRAHHSCDAAWIDCNFGGVLIIFDRLFGTLVAEPAQGGLNYGLVTPLVSNNPVRIALNQWAVMISAFGQARSWSRRWTILFGRPDALEHDEPVPQRRGLRT